MDSKALAKGLKMVLQEETDHLKEHPDYLPLHMKRNLTRRHGKHHSFGNSKAVELPTLQVLLDNHDHSARFYKAETRHQINTTERAPSPHRPQRVSKGDYLPIHLR
jgi:hypothetical protein